MTSHLYILTGASRGMGLGLARQLLQPGNELLCISRKANDALTAQAAAGGIALTQWTEDLAHAGPVALRLKAWLQQPGRAAAPSATLVNNAGVVPDIGPLEDGDPARLIAALRIDLEAPMLLCAAFLDATRGWTGPRKILNISSGLGRRAMAAQAGYCAAKAGMDHFTRCLALDEAQKPHGAQVCSLAPGVIDTDMQIQLRGPTSGSFPDQGNFIGMKEKGMLSSPDEAAARLIAWLARPDFGSNPVADVRDA